MGKKVLIVEDAALVRSILIEIIHSTTEHTVIGEADNGKDAIEAYQKLKPDIVFMDAIMPVMDGLQALKEIRKIDPNANVIICSAEQRPADVLDALKSGARDYILKPFDPERVAKCVNKNY